MLAEQIDLMATEAMRQREPSEDLSGRIEALTVRIDELSHTEAATKLEVIRVLTDVDLFEVSLVTFPANEAARVSEVLARFPGHGTRVARKRPPELRVK